jgi:hypothetical protein
LIQTAKLSDAGKPCGVGGKAPNVLMFLGPHLSDIRTNAPAVHFFCISSPSIPLEGVVMSEEFV